MTRVAWWHCFSGIAGDMALASLLDAGADLDEVIAGLEKIPISGWHLEASKTWRGGLAATQLRVDTDPAEEGTERTWATIRTTLDAADGLPERARSRAQAVFSRLAVAEGRLHGVPAEDVHFHEVGGLDALVDVVGTCLALESLDVGSVCSSPVALGTGTVNSAHGVLPVPAPAVVELLRNVPVYGSGQAAELTTPTGAALLAVLADYFGPLPPVVITASGYGAGTRQLDGVPNVLQVVIGDLQTGVLGGAGLAPGTRRGRGQRGRRDRRGDGPHHRSANERRCSRCLARPGGGQEGTPGPRRFLPGRTGKDSPPHRHPRQTDRDARLPGTSSRPFRTGPRRIGSGREGFSHPGQGRPPPAQSRVRGLRAGRRPARPPCQRGGPPGRGSGRAAQVPRSLTFVTDMGTDLQLAIAAADLADRITLGAFRHPSLAVETKADETPVSEADRATEVALRQLLGQERPDDSVLGEEMGGAGDSLRRWIIDPIDGTANFVRGIPVWATLIGLEVDGVVNVGVVSAPALGRRWWAERGNGSFAGPPGAAGERINVSDISLLAEATVSSGSMGDFPEPERLLRLTASVKRDRGFGDFWSHMLVAEGACEVGLDPVVAVWDIAALQVIVEEAGGKFTDFSGQPGLDGSSAISSNGLVHREVITLLSGD